MNGIFGTEYYDGLPLMPTTSGALRGLSAFLIPVSGKLRGGAIGIEDESLRSYRLYIGTNGAEPDFTSPPFDEYSTLPISYEITDSEIRYTLRRRNGFGLESENTQSTRVVTDEGEEILAPPHTMHEITATAVGYTIAVQGIYLRGSAVEAVPTSVTVELVHASGTVTLTADLIGVDSDGVGFFSTSGTVPSVAQVVTVRAKAVAGLLVSADWLSTTVAVPGVTVGDTRAFINHTASGTAYFPRSV